MDIAELSRNLPSSLVLRESILRSVNLQEPLHEPWFKSRGMQVRYQPSFVIPVMEDTLIYAKVIGQSMLFYLNLNNVKVMLIISCLTQVVINNDLKRILSLREKKRKI